jgi:DNA polymerase-1
MRIPLDATVVQTALSARDIRLGPSLWALTGADPPSWYGERVYGEGPRLEGGTAERRIITLPKPMTTAAKKAAALTAAGQLSLF